MNYQIIRQIAKYEIKLLGRDRIFMGILFLSIILITFLHIIMQSNLKSPAWLTIALPSAISFTNAYFVNFLQTLIVIFWAGHSIQEEQRLDSFLSISVRPFTNTEWLSGKISGFLFVILLFDVVTGSIAIGIHLFLSDSPFALFPYLFYFFTLSIPTIVFTTGASLFIKSILKKRFLALPCLLVIFYLGVILLANRFHGINDLFLSTQPNMLSEVTGFPHLTLYFLQRSAFLLLGCGLLIAGIHIITRIPNTRQNDYKVKLLCTSFIVSSIIFASLYLQEQTKIQQYHEQLRNIFVKYEGAPKARVAEHHITFEQHESTYQATSTIQIYNPHTEILPSIILYLNPKLEIISLTENGKNVHFDREEQVIIIPTPLSPNASRGFSLQYRGDISPEVCYAEVEHLDSLYKSRQYYHLNMGKDFYYLQSNFTLLTPECLWYPVTLPPVNIQAPYTTIQNCTQFYLTVIGEKERTPISQGTRVQRGDTTCFKNEIRLSGISLCIGNYSQKQLSVNDIQFEAYFLKQHEDFWPAQPELLPMVLQFWLQDIERNDQKYVFDKLALIEVPVNYCAYSRSWKTGSEYVQPEIIFRPEREALITQGIKIPTESLNPGIPPEAEWFSSYTHNYSLSRTIRTGFPILWEKEEYINNEYNLAILLQKHHVQITSSDFPGIHRVLQEMQSWWGTVLYSYNNNPSYENPSIYFNNHCLLDIFQEPQDPIYFQQRLQAKSIAFLTRIMYSIPAEKFQNFMEQFYAEHAFNEVDYKQLCDELKTTDSLDLLALTRQLYHEKGLPDFRVRDAQIQWIENASGEKVFLQSVKIWNKGTVDGMITITGSHLNRNIHYSIPAGTCKELKNYIPGEPEKFSLQVQTNLAQNIPAFYNFKNIQPSGTFSRATSGIFDTDTTFFINASNEFIVDNEDAGCHTIEPQQALGHLIRKHWHQEYYDKEGYGEPVRSYYIKLAGKGDSKIEWETMLPSAGMYELFVYHEEHLFKKNGYLKNYIGKEKQTISNPTQTYVFTHAEGKETIVVETQYVGYGWVSLGIFPFSGGKASITLLDIAANPNQAIIGDAVKWIKDH